MKKTKNWDNKQYYKHFRNQYYTCKVFKYLSTLTPIAILFALKWNTYFELIEKNSSIKFSIGAILCVIVAIIAVFQDIKETESEEIKLVLKAFKWWSAFAIVYCFSRVFQDLQTILLYEAIGQTGTFTFAQLETNRKKWAISYRDGITTQNAIKKGIATD